MKTFNLLLLSRRVWCVFAFVLIIALWLGVPTYRQWKADKMVDELCAKDGGKFIYEIVNLPTDRYIPSKANMKDADEYFDIDERTWIIQGSGRFGELKLYKHRSKTYRRKDEKLLSEYITYIREGGDPILLPVHPSSYSCGENNNMKTQINTQNGGIK